MVSEPAATPGTERILVTGAMGFIGLHTVRALLDHGHSCVLTSHRTVRHRGLLEHEIVDRVVVERLDVADHGAVMALGERHRIGGIVHLADPALTHLTAPSLAPATLIEDQRRGIGALLNVLEAASVWRARRVTLASTIGVYGGLEDMRGLREDTPLPASTGGNPVGDWKQTTELLATSLAHRLDVQLAIARLPAVWGPFGRNSSRFFAAPALIHAAAAGTPVPASGTDHLAYANEAIDMLYVKDCARAIALLQTREQLRHTVYNVGSGHATSNQELVQAIKTVVPNATLELHAGRNPTGAGQDIYLDTTRLRQDTGFGAHYDLPAAAADYIGWLRAGNGQ